MRFSMAILMLVIISLSCRKDDPNASFVMEYQMILDIPIGQNPGLCCGNTEKFNVNTNIDFYLNQNGVEISDIDRITCNYAYMRLDGSNEPLSYIEEVYMNLNGNQSNDEFAYMLEVPFNSGSELNLFPGLRDVSDDLTDQTFDFNLKTKFRQNNFSPMQLYIEFGFDVYLKD